MTSKTPRIHKPIHYDNCYITGKTNIVADTLSRVEGVSEAINMKLLAKAQKQDEELQQILQSEQIGLKLRKISILKTEKEVYCDTKRRFHDLT